MPRVELLLQDLQHEIQSLQQRLAAAPLVDQDQMLSTLTHKKLEVEAQLSSLSAELLAAEAMHAEQMAQSTAATDTFANGAQLI